MDKKWRIISGLFCLITAFSTTAQQTITFASEASYPPFEFINSENKMVGFDIDIANAICQKINAKCVFTNQTFPSLIPGLKFHRYDAVIASLHVTPERKKIVDFSHIYFDQVGSRFLIRKNSFTDIKQLDGQKVGAQNGTTHHQYLLHHYPDIVTVPYESYQQALLDLKNGRLAGVLGDNTAVSNWLAQNPQLTVLGPPLADKTFQGDGIAIAVRKHNNALLKQLNQGLTEIRKDGSYQTIYHRWFNQ